MRSKTTRWGVFISMIVLCMVIGIVPTEAAGKPGIKMNKHAAGSTGAPFQLIGSCPTPAGAVSVQVQGNYAYVVDGAAGFRIIDISDPSSPKEKGAVDIPSHDVYVSGKYAYAIDKNGPRLVIIDIGNPASPTETGSYQEFLLGYHLAVLGNYVYMPGNISQEISIIDVSDPQNPHKAGSYQSQLADFIRDIQISGHYAFLETSRLSIEIIDLSDPVSPVYVGYSNYGGGHLQTYIAYHASGDYLYRAVLYGMAGRYSQSFSIFNTADPANVQFMGSCDIPDTDFVVFRIFVSGGYAFCAHGTFGVRIIDVTDPSSPLDMGTFNTPGDARDVFVSNGYVFVADLSYGLKIYQKHFPTCPFGFFETPVDGAVVRGSVPVTGWALDDTGVASVKIYRETLPGEGPGLVYIGDALFVEGARPDVALAYPWYPFNNKAGWGYMLLTNFLPGEGNNTFILHATAEDKEGNQVTLGVKTITGDNAHAVKPFGAIDTPIPGGEASGSGFINWGWVLTPQPNSIPIDGSTLDVYVDGVNIGQPTYNNYRADIAALFPGYANSSGAVGYFYLDTTAYENGVHTIQWTAADSAGNTDGIGSRYFNIQNTAQSTARDAERTGFDVRRSTFAVNGPQIPVEHSRPVRVKKGFNRNIEPQEIYPGENGAIAIEIKELERLEIHFRDRDEGGEIINISPLPIGSTLDTKRGIFYWSPGPGFIGEYRLVFVDNSRQLLRKVNVFIRPGY